MSKLEDLEKELEEAKSQETYWYGKYMYEECADYGYDAKASRAAHDKYLEASSKVKELKAEISKLKGDNNE